MAVSLIPGVGAWSPGATIFGSLLAIGPTVLSDLITQLFSNGESGFAYDPSRLTTGTYGASRAGIGQPVTVGVADAAEYDAATGVGSVYRADQYNQSIINFDVDNTKQHELVIENTGATSIAVNADLAMGEILFTVAAGQRVTRLIDPIQVIVITSANDVSTAYFKIHSLQEISGGAYTMYQDAAQLVPVTAMGQSLGFVTDLSGRGNHATQSGADQRPTLAGGPQRVSYDGIDDSLVTTLAGGLTGATIARAVPNVGAQILSGQDVAASYVDSASHCGLVVIDRVLTPTETIQITRALNKLAGV